jgi:DNA-binding transcriptional regulator YdaS (Cro superfamily)
VHIRALKRAAELVGGEEELARRLRVAPALLEAWTRGVLSPPDDIFLKTADIVSEHDMQQLSVKGPLAGSGPA